MIRTLSAGRWACLIVLLGLTLIRGLIYATVIPPWQAPDENGHFEYAWLLVRLGRVPTRDDVSVELERELLASLYEWHYGELISRPLPETMPSRLAGLLPQTFAARSRTVLLERFSLAYLWQAAFLWPFQSQSLLVQLYVARFSSVLINVLIVLVAFLTFSTIFPLRPSLVLILTATLVFWPQHTFINSTVSEGPLAELMSCLVLCCWIKLFHTPTRYLAFIGIVLGTLGGVWTKATTVSLVFLNAALASWWGWRHFHRLWSRKHFVIVISLFIILILASLSLLHAPIGARVLRSIRDSIAPSEWTWIDETGTLFGEGLLNTYDSFWANFGWMALPTSERWYGAVMAISILALIGWMMKPQDAHRVPAWATIILAGSFLAAFLVFVYMGMLVKPQYWIQGRYLFPVSIPYVFFLIIGLDRIVIPRALPALLFLLVCFDTWCLAGYIFPYFYA